MYKSYIKFDNKLLTSPCETPTNIAGDCLSETAVMPHTALGDGEYYIRIKDFNWHETSLANFSTPINYQHDPLRGPNTRGDRIVTIRGVIVAKDRAGREKGVITNNALYRLENDLSFTNRGFFKLEWDGDNNDEYFCFAQVYNAKPQIQIETGKYIVTEFEVQLIMLDGQVFVGGTPQSFTVEEGFIGGEDIGTVVYGSPLDDLFNPSSVVASGDFTNDCFKDNQIPVTVTISGTGAVNPMTQAPNVGFIEPSYIAKDIIFANTTTGDAIKINYEMVPGDVIVIDGFSGNVLLNGVITNGIVDSSVNTIPSINSYSDAFILHDSTFFGTNGKQIEAIVEFNPVI